MSYYHPSFSQTVAMTRGRGYPSHSSYRGGSGRGGSWGGGRGYGSSRGGGGHFSSSFSNSYDSRSKYSDRYSGSRDDYRKPYRSRGGIHHSGPGSYQFHSEEPSPYGSRSHHSPDRKRMRTEAPSSRHDSYSGSQDGYSSSRYETSYSRRSFSGDRRTSLGRREEFRKPGLSSGPRGGYRGRIGSRGRGSRLREHPMRRRLVDNSYAIRKRVVASQSDIARRIRLAKLRSAAIRRAALKKHKSSPKEDGDEKDDDEEEEEEEENWDKEVTEDEKKPSEDNEEKDASEAKENEGEEKKSPKKESKEISDKEDKASDTESPKKKYIKLQCIHCSTKCLTFGKYNNHLLSGRHAQAMRRVALKQKAVLSRMRMTQRKAQRELEKTTDDLAPRTNFCPLCKLNYRQPKTTHQNSDLHKNMKKFLMPYCKTCRISFKSPMLYENHLCSIEHLKRKARTEVNGEKSDKDDSTNEEDHLENFMTIDSVGDVDDEEGEGRKKEPEDINEVSVGIEQIRKVEVYYCDLCRMYLPRVEDGGDVQKVLVKHCKHRIHMQRYIRYKEDKEIAKHAERLQRKENAEKKEHQVKTDKEEKDTDSLDVKTEAKKEKNNKEKPTGTEEEDAEDNKLWADVDKDLGDILAGEAEAAKSDEDEDDDSHINGERYDRFKYSEKVEEEKLLKGEGTEEEAKEKSVAANVVEEAKK